MFRNRFYLSVFLIALVSGWGLFTGCGEGGDGTSTIGSHAEGLMSGSVGLGPISGGKVIVRTLSGTWIGSGTTIEFDPAADTFRSEGKTFLKNKEDRRVGKFTVDNLVRSGLSDEDIVIVTVTGGWDVDPNDDGFIGENEGMDGPFLDGDIYAVAKLIDLVRGNVVVNVFTTMSFAGLQGSLDPDEVKARLDRFACYIFKDPNATPDGGDLNRDGVVDMFDIYYYDPTNHDFQGTESSRIHDHCLRGQHFLYCLIPNNETATETFAEALLNGAGADFIEDFMAAAKGYGDADGDGLSNIFEDPASHDTDGDGMFDADSLEIDMDDDGIPDEDEFRYGLNPWVDDASDDTDRDGINNIKEIANGLNPVDGSDGATADSDGDGLSNSLEIEAGTNPKNSAPQPLNTTIPLSVDENASGGVAISASDPEGNVIRYVISGPSIHGTASIDASGYLTYEPFADYHGTDALTVQLNDSANGGIVTVRVDVIVNETTPKRPALNVTASPGIIQIGGSAVVAWSATHADFCFVEPRIGIVDVNGSIQVVPRTTTTYTITASGPGGTASGTVTVVVLPPPFVSISASPGNIPRNTVSTLNWNSSDADACVIEPGIGSVGVIGSIQVAPAETTTYTIVAQGPGGTAAAQVTITVYDPQPSADIAATPGTIIMGESSILAWSSTHADACVIEPGIGSVDPTGSIAISPVETTSYTITATGSGGTATANATVVVNYPLPGAGLSVNPEGIVLGESSILTWNTTDATSANIDHGIGDVALSGSMEVSPSETTTYTLTVVGPGGATTKSKTLTIHMPPPTVSIFADPETVQGGEASVLSWSSTNAQDAHIDNGIGAVAINGSATVYPEHTQTYTIVVTGQTGSASSTIPVTVAGNPEPLPEGSYGAQYEDLIPPDATLGKYDPKRFSVVTGMVRDINDLPVGGVLITVLGRQEYGTTLTDVKGRFSIPVEGGSSFTLVYQKEGRITAHRKIYVPWNDSVALETIRMIPEDTAATTLTFDGNPDTVITHRSSQVIDVFGIRSATMVFNGDNQMYLQDKNGNDVQEIETITTRATEFTTPESMPAKLPPTSAYTYCTEFSVDGVQRVRFEKPIIVWVDNFLGFDVGEIVPVGYYDRDRGLWVPSENGIVVALLDTDGDGLADAVDADGNAQPDDIDNDGSFTDETTGLDDVLRYPPGSTFWRVAITHFSPWDCNWPFGLPLDAVSPVDVVDAVIDLPGDDSSIPPPENINCLNSYVQQRNRIFHEDIPIPGTDAALHYASNRVKGYVQKITVPASGDSVPDSLKRIIVRVDVAGRTLEQILDPLPGQKAEFVWDGLDHLGRPVSGPAVVRVGVGFEYDLVYYNARGDFARAFGQTGGSPTGISARQPEILWKRNIIHLPCRISGLAEGWTLSVHHHLSPLDPSTLLKGNGTLNQNNVSIITRVVGGGTSGLGDGGPGTEAQLYNPHGMAVDASGNVYIADWGSNRIRKVDTSGIVTTVAGNGGILCSGDGGPATEATLWAPVDVAVDASGNLYIADYGNNRVRKVDTNGIITTVAGSGFVGSGGDGGPATEARFNEITSIAVDSSGNLYITDHLNQRVRKVDTNGIITTVANGAIYPGGVFVDTLGNIYVSEYWNYRVRKIDTSGVMTTVAGNGTRGYSGDGGPATEAQLNNPSWVTGDTAGNIYIKDSSNYRIRKVDTSGIITTVAGNGIEGVGGDDGPAVEAQVGVGGIAIDASMVLYTADGNNLRKISAPSSFADVLAEGGAAFAEDSGMGHIMSNTGLHLQTIDLETSNVLRKFDYDGNNNLVSIEDQFGGQVTVERNGGVPTAIIAPDGIRTELTVDTDNHLTRITYADGSFYEFEYNTDGLMTAETDPGGNQFDHQFDSTGRLTDVFDEEGGYWNYSGTVNANGDILTEVISGEGNLTRFLDRTYSTGMFTSTTQDATGAEILFARSGDELTVNETLTCGKEITYHYGLDPQYTFKFVKEITERAPSGLEKVVLRNKAYQDTDSDNIPDLITDTVSVNGKTTSVEKNILQSRKVLTSPEGRTVTTLYDSETLLTQCVTVPGLFETTYGYDSRGRLTSVDTDARKTLFTYNAQGFVESITDAEGFITDYIYDGVGRLKRVERSDGGSVGFAYDLNGNMTVLTNPSGIDHGFGYNAVNKNNIYQTPLSGSYQYTYDRDRRLIQTCFPSGRKINNRYDSGRLEQVQTPEGNIDYTYFCGTAVASVVNGNETISYEYDGSLVTLEGLTGVINQTLEYSYNSDFDLSEITYAGSTTVYSYDDDGLLIGAGDFSINRNAANAFPETVTGGTLNIARTFSGYGEMEEQRFAIGGSHVLSWNLYRDKAGKITAKSETKTGVASGYLYSYDAMGRLLAVYKDGILVEEYEYNLNGVRTYEMNLLRGIAGRTMSYSDEDHLLNAGDAQYQYDVDGFLVSRTEDANVTTYDYSSMGELLGVVLPGGTNIGYTHDPLGRRIAKKVNGVIAEKYLWQGWTRLLAVYDGSDNLIMRFDYADGRMPVAMKKEGSTYYLTYDPVGSLRFVADSSGNVVKRIEYDSFGNIVEDTNTSFQVPFGFAGGLHDRDTGLVRFGYRDYDPDTGRWTAKDPIFFAGGDMDLYGYCLNDPVNLVDPLGLEFADILPGIHKAFVEGIKGSAYAVGATATATADIAMNGHPLAKTAVCIAFVSEAVPLAGAVGIHSSPFIISAAHNAAPYSGVIVDLIYGWLPQTGPPKGFGGYVGSFARWVFETYYNYFSLNQNSKKCEK